MQILTNISPKKNPSFFTSVDQECHDHIGKPEELPTNLRKELVLCLLRIDQGKFFIMSTEFDKNVSD